MLEALVEFAAAHEISTSIFHVYLVAFLKVFVIPGVTVSFLLGGVVFGLWQGIALSMTALVLGSVLLRTALMHFHADVILSCCVGYERIKEFTKEYERQFGSPREPHTKPTVPLILYFASYRMYPWTPSWFITAACVHVHLPFWRIFLPSVVLGSLPYCVVTTLFGFILKHATLAGGNTIVWKIVLAVCALCLAIPHRLFKDDRRQGFLPPKILKKITQRVSEITAQRGGVPQQNRPGTASVVTTGAAREAQSKRDESSDGAPLLNVLVSNVNRSSHSTKRMCRSSPLVGPSLVPR